MQHPRHWFGPKRLGWGYSPRTKEGWLIIGLFVAGCIAWKTLS